MSEFMNRVGRPMQNATRTGGEAPAPQSNGGNKQKGKFNLSKVVSSVLLVSVTILLVALIVYLAFGKTSSSISDEIKTDQYQAVFLNSSDGQVYFGKLSVFNSSYYKLTDIYYVRVQQVQPDKNSQPQQSISLAKLGSEIHGPEDVMYVNRDSVMFWENLKEDGQVVKAIREYQKNGTTGTDTNTDSTTNNNSTNTNTTNTNSRNSTNNN
jgi:hypothetical protein